MEVASATRKILGFMTKFHLERVSPGRLLLIRVTESRLEFSSRISAKVIFRLSKSAERLKRNVCNEDISSLIALFSRRRL